MLAQDIKEMYSMRDVVSRYGVHINRAGFCSCPFHTGDRTPSLKIYKDSFHCHACGANGDIFTWIQKMDGISFKQACIELGGQEELSFSAKRRIEKAKTKRKEEEARKNKAREELRLITMNISAYRECMGQYEPLTDEHAYFFNKLQYQLYLLEKWGDNNRTNKQSNC